MVKSSIRVKSPCIQSVRSEVTLHPLAVNSMQYGWPLKIEINNFFSQNLLTFKRRDIDENELGCPLKIVDLNYLQIYELPAAFPKQKSTGHQQRVDELQPMLQVPNSTHILTAIRFPTKDDSMKKLY